MIRDVEGHDAVAIDQAVQQAKAAKDQPSLICCKTVIGFGSPNKAGSHSCHGAPLGIEEVEATRKQLGWSYPPFVIPDEIYSGWNAAEAGVRAEGEWNTRFAAYQANYPELAAELERRNQGQLPTDWQQKTADYIQACTASDESPATRKASQNCLNAYGPELPEFLGGSADLTPSNLTAWSGSVSINDGHEEGNYLSYGVREFGMSAIMNGIALHGGFIPYGATFLMFSEYARNALRMAALMKIRSIFVYTHDSIGLGEDGPTHQAVEQIPTLRMIPNMSLWRPCDSVETAVAWKTAIEKTDGPSCLVFSRQGLPHMSRTSQQINDIARGGYILADCEDAPEAIIIATGSEVGLAMTAAAQLKNEGIAVRVVSMPATDVFDAQDASYQESVLPPSCTARVAVEAAVTDGWYKYVGLNGKVLGMHRFGESAPAGQLFTEFGFTTENLAQMVKAVLA